MVPLNVVRSIQSGMSPEEALARWPADEPLALLFSGRGPLEHARWTVLARPGALVRVRAGEDWERACAFLRAEVRRVAPGSREGPMFTGGWVGWISYDFGREVERRAMYADGAERDRDWALMEWQRCDHALVHDRATGAWWVVGEGWECVWRAVIQSATIPHGPASSGRSARGARSRVQPSSQPALLLPRGGPREAYIAACERVLEYIRAGDVYQVNLAHRLSYTFEGSTRELFQRLLVTASPWFGAYLEATDGARRHAVCSVSPELLFRIEGGTGRIVTRPMKGTRAPADGAAEALRESAKDQAELNMIVDLMRNDLGRVCEVGSVRVERGREVEWHGEPEPGSRDPATAHRATGLGILQATATVGGVVRAGLTVADVIRALVPGGSVTGAPKIRAMQIIDELEPMRRGPYCGAIGFVGDDGSCAMNVGIRTALIHGRADPASSARDAIAHGVMDYSVGAGIVADSAAESEWLETLEKAGVLRALDLG